MHPTFVQQNVAFDEIENCKRLEQSNHAGAVFFLCVPMPPQIACSLYFSVADRYTHLEKWQFHDAFYLYGAINFKLINMKWSTQERESEWFDSVCLKLRGELLAF